MKKQDGISVNSPKLSPTERRASRYGRKYYLYLLIIIAALLLSALALMAYDNLEQSNLIDKLVREELTYLSTALAEPNKKLVEEGRNLLVSYANNSSVSDQKSCNSYLKREAQTHPQYSSIGVADSDGNVICSSVELKTPVNLGDRNFFQQSLNQGVFSIGNYQIGRISGLPVLPLGYPIAIGDKSAKGVVFVGLNLQSLGESFSNLNLPPKSEMFLIDKTGVILADANDSKQVGKNIIGLDVVRQSLEQNDVKLAKAKGLDGVVRQYIVRPIATNSNTFLVLGIPSQSLGANIAAIELRTAVGIAIIALIGFIIIAILGRKLLVVPYAQSSSHVKQLEGEAEQHMFQLFENAPDPILTIDTKGVITSANKAGMELSGLPSHEVVGHNFLKLTRLIPANSMAVASRHLSEMLKGKQRDAGFEVELNTHEGRRLFDVSTAAIHEADELVGFQVILRDITDRSANEKALQEKTEELEKLNKIMTEREINMVELKKENQMLKRKAKD